MSRACCFSLGLAAWMAINAAVHCEEAKPPLTDLYGDPLPPEAVVRLGTIRLRHAGAVVTFSTDGKQVISCDQDGEVRVWDASSGALLRRTQLGLKSGPRRISLAPGGAVAEATPAAMAKNLMIYFYDTKTGRELGRLAGARMLAFSPDGKKLAAQWKDENGWSSVRLWDIMRSKIYLNLDLPPHTVILSAVFAPDGKQLAAVGGEKYDELFLWDAVTGKLRKRMKFRAPIVSLAYASNGTTLAVGRYTKVEVVLLDAADLKEKAVLPAPEDIKEPGIIGRLTSSPDGQILAGQYIGEDRPNENSVFLWDLNRPKAPWRLPAIATLAFAPNGKTLIYQDRFGIEIFMRDVASGRQVLRPPGHDTSVAILTVFANGRRIASSAGCIGRNRLRLWDAGTGAPLRVLQGNDEWINYCLFSPDGKCVFSAGANGTFQLWDVASGKELQRMDIDSDWRRQGFEPRARAAGISADGKRLMAVVQLRTQFNQGSFLTWNLTTGKRLMQRPYRSRSVPGQVSERLDHAAFSPDDERMTVWLRDRVGIVEIATGSLLATLPKGECKSIQFAPDGRFVKATINPRNLSLIEVASGEEVISLPIDEYVCTAFTPDSRALVEADSERLRVWDALTGERLHEMAWPQEVPHEPGGVSIWSLAVLPNGRAATGMSEGDILIWDLAPGQWKYPKSGQALDRTELDALWADLAGNARAAWRAIPKLAAAPRQTISFLNEHLRPTAPLDTQRIEKLLADLDSDSFAIRDAAPQELTRLRYRLEAMLRRALENKPSLEMRRRVEAILAEPKRPPVEARRTLRAIAILERIGTPAARRVLEKLAGGAAPPETREAQAALRRLKLRTVSGKEGSAP